MIEFCGWYAVGKIETAIAIAKSSPSVNDADFRSLQDMMDQVCSQIAQRFKLYSSNGKLRRAAIIAIIPKSACLACIARELSQATAAHLDALYMECHRLAVNVLVEELYNFLRRMGYNVMISTETKLEYGKADVTIAVTKYGIDLKCASNELLVEVKTGNSLSLSQLLRYLMDKRSKNIVVWRVRRRQILFFNAESMKPLLMEFVRMIFLRGTRLLSSPQSLCRHVQLPDYEPTQEVLQTMFQDFAKALIETLPHILEAITERLGGTMTLSRREMRSIQILAQAGVVRVDRARFHVNSQSKAGQQYEVTWRRKNWHCVCEDFIKHRRCCKHIYAVGYYLKLREIAVIAKHLNSKPECPKCGNDQNVIKRGIRHNLNGSVQRLLQALQ